MGTLSDAAAREEVVLSQPVYEIFFPHLLSTLRDKRGGKFKKCFVPIPASLLAIPFLFSTLE